MTAMLLDEAQRDAGPLGAMLFGDNAFTDSKNVSRGEYLNFLRYANEHGITKKDGTFVPPDEWAMLQRTRTGDEAFWADLHEAYHLNPVQGLAKVRLAMEPQTPPLPQEGGS